MPDAGRRSGILVAVVGPSGAGKDTLIRLALEALSAEPRVRLVRRTVTRTADAASEDHDSLDEAAFRKAEAAGAFCLTWQAHGLLYALPASVEAQLGEGGVLLANLSRRSLAEAAERFGRIAVVEVTAPREVLVQRLAARGREPVEVIAARLDREARLLAPLEATDRFRIDNSGPPADGAARLCAILAALLARGPAPSGGS